MEIIVDNREHELIKMCKHFLEIMPTCKDIILTVKPLPIGDIIISYEGKEKLIVERKSLADLSSSIKDGRYEEQSYRLNGLPHHNHNIIYLIEGDMNRLNMFKNRIDKMMLYSAMVTINHYKGFSLMRSQNLEETAIILCNMAYKIRKSAQEFKVAFYSNVPTYIPVPVSVPLVETPISNTVLEHNTSVMASTTVDADVDGEKEKDTEKDYCTVVKRVKKENVTQGNIGEIMLCQIPGISSVTALAIMAQFKTISNLIIQLKDNEHCMKDISYTNAKGQTRKISKTVIANIVTFLKQ